MEEENDDTEHIGLNYIDSQSLLGLISSHAKNHNIQISDLLNVLKAGNIKSMYVPTVGMVDGIIQTLIEKNRAT